MTPLLESRSVFLSVGQATLIDGIDLTVAAGETLAIVGPNGAGKSTLLRLLSGDIRATRGAVSLRGRDLQSYRPTELALQRAMLSQHVTVSFPFTVDEIVGMGGGGAGRMAQQLADAAIDEVGLSALRHRELPTLSGGEQQRTHFARVLCQLSCGELTHGPGILLLDEPTSNLDLHHQIALVGIARRRARRGTAVVAVLHDLNLAIRFADRIVVLRAGKIIADGKPDITMTSDVIRRAFDITTDVRFTRDGSPFVLPQTMEAVPAARNLL